VHRPTSRANALTNVLNDRSRTTIGDPWRGAYHVAIGVTNHGDTDQLLSELQSLSVNAQVNVGSVDRIAIYDPDGLKRLLALGDSLDEWAAKRLTTLVVPEDTLVKASLTAFGSISPRAGAMSGSQPG
jgi:hypothetical protein